MPLDGLLVYIPANIQSNVDGKDVPHPSRSSYCSGLRSHTQFLSRYQTTYTLHTQVSLFSYFQNYVFGSTSYSQSCFPPWLFTQKHPRSVPGESAPTNKRLLNLVFSSKRYLKESALVYISTVILRGPTRLYPMYSRHYFHSRPFQTSCRLNDVFFALGSSTEVISTVDGSRLSFGMSDVPSPQHILSSQIQMNRVCKLILSCTFTYIARRIGPYQQKTTCL